jgi:uncharacterized protein
MILLDTSILVYAVGAEHRLRAPCRRLIELVADGTVVATTTVEAIQEFVHVRARRRSRGDAAELGRAYATLLAPLAQPTSTDLDEGLRLFEHQTELGTFDAVLATTALRLTAGRLASADRAFQTVAGLTVLNPADDGFEHALLSAGR